MSKRLTPTQKKQQRQWEKDNLVMSGSQLSSLLGVSMPKIIMVINQGLLGFPKPAKFRYVGNKKVNYYHRSDLQEFMARVDIKNVVVTGWGNKPGYAGNIKIIKADTTLYLQFLNVDKDSLKHYGTARYDLGPNERAKGGCNEP